MATFTITVNNSLNLFGPEDSNKWGGIVWGEDNWGYGDVDLTTKIFKVLENSLSLDSIISTLVIRFINVTNTLSIDVDMGSEEIREPNGYYRILGSGQNAETRPLTSYNELSDIVTSYSAAADITTIYTEI